MRRPLFFFWLACAVFFTLPFWFSPLDLAISRFFYNPELTDPWPIAASSWARFFYRAAPVLTILLGGAGLGMILAGSLRKEWRAYRLCGLCVFLLLALGPGLVVNAVFKDYAGRSRPRQLVEFGGTQSYEPPLLFNGGEGKSFPCGHCSVGFAFGIFALFFWRKQRKLAWTLVVFSLLLGSAMGLGRIAAGAHFFSDVLWAGLLVWGVAGVLWGPLLRVTERLLAPDKFPPLEGRAFATFVGIPLGALMLVCLAFLATPFEQTLSGSVASLPERTLKLVLPRLPSKITYTSNGPALEFEGSFSGFGFPGRKVKLRQSAPDTFAFYKRGLFTELDGSLILRVNISKVRSLSLRAPQSPEIQTNGLAEAPALSQF